MPNNDEYDQAVKEAKFARAFWKTGGVTKGDALKGVTLFVICIGVIVALFYSPVIAVIGVTLYAVTLIVVTPDLRGRIGRALFRRTYDQVQDVNTFHQLRYYFLKGHDEILFIENGRDLTAVGLFQLQSIPLIIKGNFERFIRSLYQQQVSVYWTYAQSPVDQGAIRYEPVKEAITEEMVATAEEDPQTVNSQIELNSGIWVVRLLLGTRRTVSARLNIEAKRLALYQELTADLFKIRTAFTNAYPHTILKLLRGKMLEKAFSVSITCGGIPDFF